jgi:adenosine deaminase
MRIAFVAAMLVSLTAVASPGPQDLSARTANYFERIKANRTLARAFLQAMPKGGDLHIHLSGAVYAEAYVRWAAEPSLGLCYDPVARTIAKCDDRLLSADKPDCKGTVPVPMADAARSDVCVGEIVDNLSMRNFRPNSLWAKRSGHDQFFSAFARFRDVSGQRPAQSFAWLARNAALQNVVYVEPMLGLGSGVTRRLGVTEKLAGDADADYAAFETLLREHGIEKLVEEGAASLNQALADARVQLGCGTATPQPACDVTIRVLGQSNRVQPVEDAFAQIMLNFMVAHREPNAVGVNFVAPEDFGIALRDYTRHMKIHGYFKRKYADVGLSLHAGELWLGLVELENLTFHIREAVEIAGADRIGHGVDIGYERSSEELLATMAAKGVAVEINLSSNEQILGVKGDDHPFPAYWAAGVPVVLSTDDEGVERIDITSQYQLASERYGLSYRQLKLISRQSLEKSFLPGDSLWRDIRAGLPVPPCAQGRAQVGGLAPSPACATFLDTSQKARLQWELERRFADFEREYAVRGRRRGS